MLGPMTRRPLRQILIAVGALHDHVANNSIGDAKHAIEFCNLGGISVEIDEGVDTIGQTIDLVSEFTLAPLVDVVNLACALGDRGLDSLHDGNAIFVGNGRGDKKQQFVSLHQLTSFGLYGPGLVKAYTGAGISPSILAKGRFLFQTNTHYERICIFSSHIACSAPANVVAYPDRSCHDGTRTLQTFCRYNERDLADEPRLFVCACCADARKTLQIS